MQIDECVVYALDDTDDSTMTMEGMWVTGASQGMIGA